MAVDKVRGYHGRMTAPKTAPNSRAEQKKNLITLIVLVAVLDAIMIGIYSAMHVADRSIKSQQTFVAIWVVLTLIIVTTVLKRIRQARRRRQPRG